MPIKDGTGPDGKGPMTGHGHGKCILPINTAQEEINFLKNREKVLREQLGQIEARIEGLEASSRKEINHENRRNSLKSKSGV
jgi:hypothetical protein